MSKRREEIQQRVTNHQTEAKRCNFGNCGCDHCLSVPFLLSELDRKDNALREIANHPHSSEPPLSGRRTASRDYLMGVQDGHRCAASIARTALTEEES